MDKQIQLFSPLFEWQFEVYNSWSYFLSLALWAVFQPSFTLNVDVKSEASVNIFPLTRDLVFLLTSQGNLYYGCQETWCVSVLTALGLCFLGYSVDSNLFFFLECFISLCFEIFILSHLLGFLLWRLQFCTCRLSPACFINLDSVYKCKTYK